MSDYTGTYWPQWVISLSRFFEFSQVFSLLHLLREGWRRLSASISIEAAFLRRVSSLLQSDIDSFSFQLTAFSWSLRRKLSQLKAIWCCRWLRWYGGNFQAALAEAFTSEGVLPAVADAISAIAAGRGQLSVSFFSFLRPLYVFSFFSSLSPRHYSFSSRYCISLLLFTMVFSLRFFSSSDIFSSLRYFSSSLFLSR